MKKLLPFLLLISIFSSCDPEGVDINPEEEFQPSYISNDVASDLAQRVNSINSPGFSVSGSANSISYTHVASVAPNQVNGLNLSATGVAVLRDKAYVTYHVRGENYGGEILTFDIANPSNPTLLKSLVDVDADYNDVMMGQHEGNIWVAGARNIDVSGYQNSRGAIATKIGLDGNKLPKNNPSWEAALSSFSASSITRVDPPAGQSNGRIFVTSGSQGGISVIRGNDVNQVFHTRQVNNAKHFDFDNDKGVFLRGNGDGTSTIDIYALDDSFTFNSFTINYDVTPLGKNGIDVDGNVAYLAMGVDGVIKLDITTGSVLATYQSNGNGLANAVEYKNGHVYVAYGSDGLVLLDDQLTFETSYKFDGSCNYVHVTDDMLFIANGSTGGLVIMSKD